jgi:hypothetical protein
METSYVGAVIGALRSGVRLSTCRMALMHLLAAPDDGPLGLDTAWRKRKISASIESDVFAELLRSRRPELGVALFNQVDKVSHLYWKYWQPEPFSDVTPEEAARYAEAINELYGEADRVIGKVLNAVPEDAEVVIVSDHGFRPALRKITGSFCRVRTDRLLGALSASDDVVGSNLDQKVYLEPSTSGGVDSRHRLAALETALRSIHLEGESVPFFDVVRDGDVLVLTIAPRDVIPQDAGLVLPDGRYAFDALIDAQQEARFSGEHAPDGVYLHAGPLAANAPALDSLSVLDVAPTMAGILGLPPSELWTGRAALDASAIGTTEFAVYPPPAALAEARAVDNDEHLRDVLRSLGYLD